MNLSELSKLTEDEARETLERIRWPNGPVCAHCGCTENVTKFNGKKHRKGVYKCNDCGQQFTVTVNSVMEASHISIRHWLMAFSIMCSAKKGVSALQLQRQLGLGSYRSAWHLCHRIRHAMSQDPLKGLLSGEVIADETYVGGKPRKGDKRMKEDGKHIVGRGTPKVPVLALVERGGRARAWPIARVSAKNLKGAIREHVAPSATIMTDEFVSYHGIGKHFEGGHHTVNHGRGEYVRKHGNITVSTNECEAYFSLLKRGVMGSFHHVSRQHLHRYCNEFSYRWNERKTSDEVRTAKAIALCGGARLMYQDPIKRTVPRADDPNAPF
jgi:transposase-like protein